MSMVAATAAGLALSRAYYEQVMVVARARSRSFEYRGWVYLTAVLALPFVAGLAWCRLRRPYRPTRRLAREPGTVALLAATVSIVAIAIFKGRVQQSVCCGMLRGEGALLNI